MRLNEFADQRSYTLPPEEMAAILELLEGIWYHYDLDDDALHLPAAVAAGGRGSTVTDESCHVRTKLQSRLLHLSSLRSL
jgi:hypothetical protein